MGERLPSVCVIGLGYIGLPTAATLASRKVRVSGVDVNSDVVETVNRGDIHIAEPELDMLLHAAVSEGYLHATSTPSTADVFIIAVPTPFRDGHQPDLSYVEDATESIAKVLDRGNLVIVESTSPVGTTEQVSQRLADARPDLSFPHDAGEAADVNVAYCPERVLPGNIVHELVANDRIIGGITRVDAERACALYRLFISGGCYLTDARTAEMAKLTENAFRDVNIAFANELSRICHHLGIDTSELIDLTNDHPRVNILNPGPGVGGHCVAVDPWFIVASAPEQSRLIHTARAVNASQPGVVLDRIMERLEGLDDPTVACLGLTYKPNVSDLRESPSLEIAERLATETRCRLLCVDPYFDRLPDSLAGHENVELVTMADAIQRSELLVGLVRHQAFVDELPQLQVDADAVLDFANLFSS